MPGSLLTTLGPLLIPPAVYLILRWRGRRRTGQVLTLPPGPKGWPIIGSALDIPTESMGPVYARWAKKFGSDIVSANALGTTIVVLDSYETAIELLEKRASKYSCRPRLVMLCEVMGWSNIFIFNPYGDVWKTRRRLFTQHFRSPGHSDLATSAPVYTAQTYEFVHRLILDLDETPGEVYSLTRHMVGSLAISLAYGIPVNRRHDEFIKFADSVTRMFIDLFAPGAAIVDVFPVLDKIPEFVRVPMPWTESGEVAIPVPGMGWKRTGKGAHWISERFKTEPYDKAVKGFGTDAGIRPSFTSESLIALEGKALQEDERKEAINAIQDAAATVFGTAADTTANALLTHIFALATHSDMRRRIQNELDALLIESDSSGKFALRLPTFEDQAKLPLLMAAVMESQRWAPVAPIGVPHRTTEDDVYKGYFVPKGSVVIANIWSMLNDNSVYGEDVFEFNPERFIRPKVGGRDGEVEVNPDIRHPATIAFGFGRRTCPGSHIAQSTLWLTSACLLTLFDFEIPESEKANYIGKDGMVDPRFDPGVLCHPKKFECELRVRSEAAKALLVDLEISMATS